MVLSYLQTFVSPESKKLFFLLHQEVHIGLSFLLELIVGLLQVLPDMNLQSV